MGKDEDSFQIVVTERFQWRERISKFIAERVKNSKLIDLNI